jgi:anti-anti-sigma factor
LDGLDDDNLGFSIEVVVLEFETRVTLRGEIDLTVREEISRVLEDAATGGRRVVLDMSGVSFLDSTGIGAFARAAASGSEVLVVNPQPAVRRALEVSGIDHVVRIVDDD